MGEFDFVAEPTGIVPSLGGSVITTAHDSPITYRPPAIEDIIARAVELHTPGAELEKLLSVWKDMQAVKLKAAFAGSMADFRAKCPRIQRQHVNPTFSRVAKDGTRKPGTYADLDDIASVIDPICAKLGLSYSFPRRELRDGKLIVWTRILHRDGHQEEYEGPPIECGKPIVSREGKNVQSVAQVSKSDDSYAKRASLESAFGLVTSDDDVDGNAPDGSDGGDDLRIGPEQVELLAKMIATTGSDMDRMTKYFGVRSLDELTTDQCAAAVRMLQAKGTRAKT